MNGVMKSGWGMQHTVTEHRTTAAYENTQLKNAMNGVHTQAYACLTSALRKCGGGGSS